MNYFCHNQFYMGTSEKHAFSVIPAKAGIQNSLRILDSRWSLPPTLIGGENDNTEKKLSFSEISKIFLSGLLCMLLSSACGDNINSETPDVDLSLISAGTITGTVTDATTGLPVSGVAFATSPQTVSATTSSTGEFTLSGITSGTYDLIATKTGYSTHTTEDLVLDDQEGVNVTIALTTSDGVLQGAVVNTSEHGINNVSITLIDEQTNTVSTQTATNTTGIFTLTDIPQGTYTIRSTPSDTSYCSLDKQHVAITGTHSIMITLSGQPSDAATYVGSSTCNTCHEGVMDTYSQTSHAQVLKSTDDMVSTAKSAFDTGASLIFDIDSSTTEVLVPVALSVNSSRKPQMTLNGSGPYEITKIYGGQTWKENYLTTIDGHTYVLPIAWSVRINVFILDEEENWFASDGTVSAPAADQTYEQRCIGCHVTGFTVSVVDGKTITSNGSDKYLEENIGCERCHGPGSEHAAQAASASKNDSLKIVQPRYLSLEQNSQVCGQCHAKGHASHFSGATVSYPVDSNGNPYKVGKDLDDYLTPSNDTWDSTNYSKTFHQEYPDYLQSGHYSNGSYNTRCSDCHNPHQKTDDIPHLLKLSVNDNTLCLGCHTALNFPTTASIQLHTQHPYDPSGSGASRCVGCHFTKTGTLAEFADVGGHTFNVVSPSLSLESVRNLTSSGATNIQEQDVIPNPCTQCHNDLLTEASANGETSNALGGDPTSEAYLEILVEAYEAKYDEAQENGTYTSFSHTEDGWMDKNSANHHGLYYLDNPETCKDSCHGKDFEGGELSDGTLVPSCFTCHYSAPHDVRLELDGLADSTWILEHHNYYTETACTLCHGEDYRGGISGVSCYDCHATPGEDFTEFTEGCANALCHGTPPANGAHSAHYNGNFIDDVSDPQYGDTENYSTENAYRFGCGTCHPMSEDKHMNGSVNVELHNTAADASTLKGKMPYNARYDSATGTCKNVYCHSYTEYTGTSGGKVQVPFPLQPDSHTDMGSTIENQILAFNENDINIISSYFIWNNFAASSTSKLAYYWSLPLLYSLDSLCAGGSSNVLCTGGVDANGTTVSAYDDSRFGYKINYPNYELNEVRTYQETPAWESGLSLGCGGCHGFPPRSYLTEDEWSEADPNWDNGAPSILSEAAIDKHSFVIPKLTEDGKTTEVGHMANMRPFSNAPLRCQVCHVETVSKINLTSWESGEGWSRNDKGLVELEDQTIKNKTVHVNGTVDVNFDESSVASSYRFNNTSYGYMLAPHPSYNSSSSGAVRVTGSYYGVKGTNSPGATWNATTKTCSNVSCHLEQVSVTWTNPYRPYSKAECYQCHQYYSNPKKGEDETLCVPHAEHDGCEHKAISHISVSPGPIHVGP